MATVKRFDYQKRQFGGVSPFGNVTSLAFSLETNSSGGATDADSAAQLKQGDVVILGTLPGGMRLDDASVFITTAMTASVTGKLGYSYVDGSATDDDYFFTGKSLASAGRVRADAGTLMTLEKDAYLILTIGAADNAKESDLKFVVTGELQGPQA